MLSAITSIEPCMTLLMTNKTHFPLFDFQVGLQGPISAAIHDLVFFHLRLVLIWIYQHCYHGVRHSRISFEAKKSLTESPRIIQCLHPSLSINYRLFIVRTAISNSADLYSIVIDVCEDDTYDKGSQSV